jgi:hypothetical protein
MRRVVRRDPVAAGDLDGRRLIPDRAETLAKAHALTALRVDHVVVPPTPPRDQQSSMLDLEQRSGDPS